MFRHFLIVLLFVIFIDIFLFVIVFNCELINCIQSLTQLLFNGCQNFLLIFEWWSTVNWPSITPPFSQCNRLCVEWNHSQTKYPNSSVFDNLRVEGQKTLSFAAADVLFEGKHPLSQFPRNKCFNFFGFLKNSLSDLTGINRNSVAYYVYTNESADILIIPKSQRHVVL